MLANGMLTEWEQNRTARQGEKLDMEQVWNGNGNTCGMETEHVLSSIPC